MGKVSITINGAEVKNIYPAVTIGVSAAASGDDVILFILPAGLPAFKKGAYAELDKKAEHLPNLVEMMEGLQMLEARLLVCELGLGVHDLKEEDLVDGTEIVGATTFVAEAMGSDLTFSF
jgi:predicted peroxiredoxin